MTGRQLYLVRHAQAAGSDDGDPSLSEVGRAQAAALGRRLATTGPARILCGPRRRTRDSAEVLAHAIPGVTVEVSGLLDDRTPVPSPSRSSDYPRRFHDWLAATPAAERDVDGQQIADALTALADVARAAEAGPVVAVTHAFVIGWMVRTVLDAPIPAWLRLAPSNAGLTVLDYTRDDVNLLAYNDTGHLEGLQQGGR